MSESRVTVPPSAVRCLLLCIGVGLLSACASPNRTPIDRSQTSEQQGTGIAVVAVTSREGVDPEVNPNLLARDLLEFLRDEGLQSVLPAYRVQQALGIDAYRALVRHYQNTGTLSPAHISDLRQAGLLMPFALLARIEGDRTAPGDKLVENVRDNAGQRLYDRQQVILTSQRETTMSAILFDLQSGSVLWEQTYRATPVSKAAYTEYLGSSFTGSLAAQIANTMSNGIRVQKPPPPPSMHLTLRSLMREVVRNLPDRHVQPEARRQLSAPVRRAGTVDPHSAESYVRKDDPQTDPIHHGRGLFD